MSLLEVKNLSYSYNGKQKALDSVSFLIDNTGVVGLLGANGAGKSTLMSLICGLLQPKDGSISINNSSVFKDRIMYLNSIGFLPQKPPLYPDLTIKEYLTHVAELKRINKSLIQKSVTEVMEKCGLTHLKGRLIENLSGGYQQRVGIAQAIIHAPAIIILDEPTNGLDPQQIIEIRKLILLIAKDTLVLLSTHIISEIEKISDRIIVLEHGRLLVDENINTFRNILPNNKITVSFEGDDTKKVLSALRKHEFIVEKISTNQLLISAQEGYSITDIIQLLIQHDLEITSIQPSQASIEDVYHFLSTKK